MRQKENVKEFIKGLQKWHYHLMPKMVHGSFVGFSFSPNNPTNDSNNLQDKE